MKNRPSRQTSQAEWCNSIRVVFVRFSAELVLHHTKQVAVRESGVSKPHWCKCISCVSLARDPTAHAPQEEIAKLFKYTPFCIWRQLCAEVLFLHSRQWAFIGCKILIVSLGQTRGYSQLRGGKVCLMRKGKHIVFLLGLCQDRLSEIKRNVQKAH